MPNRRSKNSRERALRQHIDDVPASSMTVNIEKDYVSEVSSRRKATEDLLKKIENQVG